MKKKLLGTGIFCANPEKSKVRAYFLTPPAVLKVKALQTTLHSA